MLKPSPNKLYSDHNSYYEFVVAVAKRARTIAEEWDPAVPMEEKPVSLAVEDFASGKCTVDSVLHAHSGKSVHN